MLNEDVELTTEDALIIHSNLEVLGGVNLSALKPVQILLIEYLILYQVNPISQIMRRLSIETDILEKVPVLCTLYPCECNAGSIYRGNAGVRSS